MARLRSLVSLAVAAAALLGPARARAIGAIVTRPAAAAQLTSARAAFAQGPSRSTLWVEARLEGAPDAVLWVVPLPKGAAVDVAASAFLDALEEATAPRVLLPGGARPPGFSCSAPPQAALISTGDWEAPTQASATATVGSESELGALMKSWDFAPSDLPAAALAAHFAGGQRALALRFEPPAGKSTTVTLRLHGEGPMEVPWAFTRADDTSPLPFTLWLLGDSRGGCSSAAELAVSRDQILWTSPEQTSYESARRALLDAAGAGALVAESAGRGALVQTTLVPSGEPAAGVVDAYLVRALERGEGTGDLGAATGRVHQVITSGGASAEGCPRGEVVAAPPPAGCAGAAPSPLSLGGQADDLPFALPGAATGRWVTRLSGMIPAGQRGLRLEALFADGPEAPVVRQPVDSWAGLCFPPRGGPGGDGSGSGGPSGAAVVVAGGAAAGAGVVGGGASDGTGDGSGQDANNTSNAVATAAEVAAESASSCSGDSQGSSSSSCGGDTQSSSSDSCGKGSSSGDSSGCSGSGSGSGCSGSSSGSGSGCNGGTGSGDAASGCSGGSSCSVHSSFGRRVRLSRTIFLLAFIVLPLRRASRRRARPAQTGGKEA